MMKNMTIASGLAMGGLMMATQLFAQDQSADAWHKDYQKARQVARDSGKPIFLVFR